MKSIVFVSIVFAFFTSCSTKIKKDLFPYKIIETDSNFLKYGNQKIYLIILEQPDSNFNNYMKADETVIELMKKYKIMYCEVYEIFNDIDADIDTITPLGQKFNLQNSLYIGKFDFYHYGTESKNKLSFKDFIFSEKSRVIKIHKKNN